MQSLIGTIFSVSFFIVISFCIITAQEKHESHGRLQKRSPRPQPVTTVSPTASTSPSTLTSINTSESTLTNISTSERPLTSISTSERPLTSISTSERPLTSISTSEKPLTSISTSERTSTRKLLSDDCLPSKYIDPFQLPPHYNKFEFPTSRNEKEGCKFEKLPVSVGIRIRNIRGVADLDEEFTMELDLITSWRDYLLKDNNKTSDDFWEERGTEYISLESSFINEIWTPDIIFSKAISIEKPAVHSTHINFKPARLRIYPDGWIDMYTRLLVKLYCPMDFKYFPADTQTCAVRLRSYSSSEADISLEWHTYNVMDGKRESVFLYGRSHPNYDIYLHDVLKVNSVEFDISQVPEVYTYLQFSLSARRKLTYHITQTYMPSAFLVILTWLSFFIPLSNLEARIGVAMTTLLTMTNKFAEVGEYSPRVSYIKAIDIYTFTCVTCVFLSLLEFTFLYWIRKGRSEYMESRAKLHNRMLDIRGKMEVVNNGDTMNQDKGYEENDPFYVKIQQYIEVYGFLLTIIFFALFNAIYWPWLFISSNYYFNDVDYDYNSRL